MDGIERYAGLTTNELALITITKLEGLEKKVGETFEQFKREMTEVKSDAVAAKTLADSVDMTARVTTEALDKRVTSIEATNGMLPWIIGGVGGFAVALVVILGEHLLGGG